METLEGYWAQFRLTTLADGWWVLRNLGLALVPLALAVALFGRSRRHTIAWWGSVLAFFAFLPNAPYVLADVTWFVRDMRWVDEEVAAFALIPLYGLFFLTGLVSYSASLELAAGRLLPVNDRRRVLAAYSSIHLMAAVGIYLGRAYDLNSWDVVARPLLVLERLLDVVSSPAAVCRVGVVAAALAVLTAACQWLLHAAAGSRRDRCPRSARSPDSRLVTSAEGA